MFSIESVTGRDFSPIADNLLMLRYVMVEGAIKPTLTVVKTRGTQHDRDTHLFEIAKGGLRVGHVLGQPGGSGFQGTHSVDMSAQDEKSKTNEI
jgi:circadian clock protein KaiC